MFNVKHYPEETGSVTVFIALTTIGLTLGLILLIEISMVMSAKAILDNDLSIAREATLENGFQMQLKNSDDPGKDTATCLARSLKQNGYEGHATLCFSELSRERIVQSSKGMIEPSNTTNAGKSVNRVRCMAYQIVLKDPYRAVTGGGTSWLKDMRIATGIEAAMSPYALYKTYRPQALELSDSAETLTTYEIDCSKSGDDCITQAPSGTSERSDGLISAEQLAVQQAIDSINSNPQ